MDCRVNKYWFINRGDFPETIYKIDSFVSQASSNKIKWRSDKILDNF